jgi:hypothetical protein
MRGGTGFFMEGFVPFAVLTTIALTADSGIRTPAGKGKEKESGIQHPLSKTQTNLSFQLDDDYFKWFVAEAFRQVGKGVHVLHRPGACLDVLRPSVRPG